MKYVVRLDGREFEVEVVGDKVTVQGETVEAELLAVGGAFRRQLVTEKASRELGVGYEDGKWILYAAGMRWSAEVLDERSRQLEAVAGSRAGSAASGTLKAPMPGLVIRVLVSEGDQVGPDTPLVVLEAMKMENEIKADRDAVVSKVLVNEGDAVEKNAGLVELESST